MLVAIVRRCSIRASLTSLDIAAGMVVGGAIGAIAARAVAMTSMPEMVALFNGLGGAASLLVGWSALSADAAIFHAGDDRAVDPDRRRDPHRLADSMGQADLRRLVAGDYLLGPADRQLTGGAWDSGWRGHVLPEPD